MPALVVPQKMPTLSLKMSLSVVESRAQWALVRMYQTRTCHSH